MAKKQQQRNKELKRNREKLKELSFVSKHPVRYSLAVASLWMIVMIAISILGYVMNDMGYLWNVNATSMVLLIISMLWIMIKIGVLESVLFRVRKHKDKSFSQKYDVKVSEITKEEYTEERETRSWVGIIVLSSISLIIFAVTMILQYI